MSRFEGFVDPLPDSAVYSAQWTAALAMGRLDFLPLPNGCDDGKPTLSEVNRSSGALLKSFEGHDVGALRSRCRYLKFLRLRSSARARTVAQTVPEDCQDQNSAKELKRLRFLHAKAEDMLAKQSARQRCVSLAHAKGLRRRAQRPGRGKGGCPGLLAPDWPLTESTARPWSVWPEFGCESTPRRTPVPGCQRFARWHRALELAEEVARNYRYPLRPCPFEAKLEEARRQLSSDAFDALRAEFLRRHGRNILQSLTLKTKLKIRSLSPTPLSSSVRNGFLQTYSEGRGGDLLPTFHGTNVSNHASIFERGLLIPDKDTNGLMVIHGSAHGLGTYSASLENPLLALGFVRPYKSALLVCGVVDDTAPTSCAASRTYGFWSCTRESQHVRVVGDAVIALKPHRIAPLFTANLRHVEKTLHAKQRARARRTRNASKAYRHVRCSVKLDPCLHPWHILLRGGRTSGGCIFVTRAQQDRAKMEWASIKHHSSKWLKAHGYWNAKAFKIF
ncbi:unnamed protein product [Symbiodinium sp. CCMP2456]|nr:unnamed protein product [Symbiodinium sp. CCMP2456]